MRIAQHCQPGGWRNNGEGPILPKQAWPEDAYVQWGAHGLVLSASKGPYTTAFFEVFLENPDTFLRGEGTSIEAAELSAWEQYERILSCPSHEFERREYRNGAGICRYCGLFKSKAFEPLEHCHICGVPTFFTCDKHDRWYCETHYRSIKEEDKTEQIKMIEQWEKEAADDVPD